MIHNSPSKRVFVVAFVAVGFLVWTLWHTSDVSTKEALLAKNHLEVSLSQDLSFILDSDKDGLSDWVENLLGTNPYSTDSDGDGVLDGKQYTSLKHTANIKVSDSPLNYLTSIGNSLANQNNSTQNGIPQPQLVIPEDHYSMDDIIIVPTNTKSIYLYVVEVLLTMETHPNPSEEEMLDVISRWLETGEEKDFKLLSQSSSNDIALAAELSELQVPSELIPSHLELINSLHSGGTELGNIDITTSNPVAGMFAAATYTNFRSKRSQAIIELTKYFNTFSYEQSG